MSQSTQAMKDYAKLECVDDYAERKRILGLNRIFRAIRAMSNVNSPISNLRKGCPFPRLQKF